jgi:hypothetical protein
MCELLDFFLIPHQVDEGAVDVIGKWEKWTGKSRITKRVQGNLIHLEQIVFMCSCRCAFPNAQIKMDLLQSCVAIHTVVMIVSSCTTMNSMTRVFAPGRHLSSNFCNFWREATALIWHWGTRRLCCVNK